MKRFALVFILTFGFSFHLYAQETSKGMQVAEGVLGTASTTVISVSAYKNSAKCSLKWSSCFIAGAEWLSAAGTAATTVMSLDNAKQHDTGGGAGLTLPTTPYVPLGGTPINFDPNAFYPCGKADPTCESLRPTTTLPTNNQPVTLDNVDINRLQNIASKQKAFIQKGMGDLSKMRGGIDINELVNNPEKYMSKEEADSARAQMASSDYSPASSDPQTLLDDLLANEENPMKTADSGSSAFSSSSYRSVATEGGVFAELPSFGDFNMDKLFADQFKQGTQNSAPGYYGNIPLKVLNPNSKKSLFERVSLKLKKLM